MIEPHSRDSRYLGGLPFESEPRQSGARVVAGMVETLAGQCESPGFQDGRADEARFSDSVYDVFCTAPGCSVLVSDPSNGRLRRIAHDPAACEAEQHAFHRHGELSKT